MHTRKWLTFHSRQRESDEKNLERGGWKRWARIRSIEYRLKRYCDSLRWLVRRENMDYHGTGRLYFSSHFSPSPSSPLLFSKRNRYLVSVYLHCWHDESAEITRISFPSSGREKRLPASLVISCRLAIAGFRSLSPGSLGVISGKLFRGSSWSTFG